MTLEKIKALKIKDNQEIPTLRELIELTANRIKLLCEVKVRGIAELLTNKLEDMGAVKSTLVISFKHDMIHIIQKLNSKIQVGYLEPTRLGWLIARLLTHRIVKKAKIHGVNAIIIQKWYLKKRLVEHAHQDGIKVFTWTISSKKQLEKALKKGVDGVLTNYVNRIQSFLEDMQII